MSSVEFWKCGKCICSRKLLVALTQVFFTLIILFFCMYQLTRNDLSSEASTIWITLLSTITGNFMPNFMHTKETLESPERKSLDKEKILE